MMQADNNAMTEVALALAMAFFAVFVLSAVSMSAPRTTGPSAADRAAANRVTDLSLQAQSRDQRALKAEEQFLVYRDGQFYDARLRPFPGADAGWNPEQHYIVGVLPSASVAETLTLKNRKTAPNLAITVLDKQWQERVEALR